MPAGAAAYHRQIQAAREVGLALTRRQALAFIQLLEVYAEELAARVAAGLAAGDLAGTLGIAEEMIRQLSLDLAISTQNGVTLTAQRVSEIYAEATLGLMNASGRVVTGAVFPGLAARSAAAMLARPTLSAAFKSIRADSVQIVDGIIQRSVLRGASTSQLARELRLHILGAEAFPPGLLLDRRRIGYQAIRSMGYEPTPENLQLVRSEAGRISDRADLIARTEIMNTQWEAHRQGAIDSPVVRAIRWRLSYRHPKPDQCDALAETDFFGLGPGVYDPRVIPRRPHPRDLCIQEDILYDDPADFGRDRGELPDLAVDLDDVGERFDLSRSQRDSLGQLFEDVRPSEGTGLPAHVGEPPSPPPPPPPGPTPTGSSYPPGLVARIRKREDQIRGLSVERATAWDPGTGAELLDKTSGLKSAVIFTSDELQVLRGSIFTHNHPSSSSYSATDVSFMLAHDLTEMRVASTLFDYSLVRPPSGWPHPGEIQAAYQTADAEAFAQFGPLVNSGQMTPDEANREHSHFVWRRVFEVLGLPDIYTRTAR